MADAAERLNDALVRHQIDIERLKAGTSDKFVKMLRKADAAMVTELLKRLDRFGETGPRAAAKVKSLNIVIAEVIKGRREIWVQLRAEARRDLNAIGRMESAISAEILEDSIGLEEFTADALPAVVVGTAVGASVWLGRTTAQHLKALELKERGIIESSIRRGAFEGLTPDEMVRDIRGSRGFGMSDGSINTVRAGLGSLMASAVLNSTEKSRDLTFAESGVITGLVWTAVLDGRTTAICQSRDGRGVAFTKDFPTDIPKLNPPGARPPAHFNCRSFMEPTLRDIGVVKPHRTFVTETRSNKKRVIDFRAQAKKDAGAGWSNLSARQRRARIRTVANQWAADNIGTVAPQVSYPEFFARQSAKFQDSVIGPTRGKLFRQGGLKIENFVDLSGKRLTLEQLQAAFPRAFIKAGF